MSITYMFLLNFATSSAYENIALNKPTYQSYPYPGFDKSYTGAWNAVDGRKSNLSWQAKQCTISANNKDTATWWVNLTSIHSIHHITIYYRTGNQPWGPSNGYTPRFLGFSLYVSNTTSKSEGTLCFKDNNFNLNTIPAIFNKTCHVQGQYVIYYNERRNGFEYPKYYSQYAFSELCEVEVYGCPLPGYGCSIPCPPKCRHCHIRTGVCCKAGYKGHRCNLKCDDGRYGDDCRYNCGHCADLAKCHNVDGRCFDGCAAGYKGPKCMEECETGTYGDQCQEHCGYCKEQGECFHRNGTCLNGCDAGYHGTFCKEECEDHYFGLNCEKMCISTCISCNKSTGVCESGCNAGWTGTYCHEECSPGNYGENCNMTCGYCKDEAPCHHINGSCLQGCSVGYQTPMCVQALKNAPRGLFKLMIIGGVLMIPFVMFLVVTTVVRKRIQRKEKPVHRDIEPSPQEGQSEMTIENKYVKNPSTGTLPCTSTENNDVIECHVMNMMPDYQEGKSETAEDSSDYINVESIGYITKDKEGCNEVVGEDDDYVNVTFTPAIPVDKLESVIASRRDDRNERFKKEYSSLPSGETHTCDIGKMPENLPKNRFPTIFPYDHTRVVLDKTDNNSSDYINANYIEGATRFKEYIATQGPTTKTAADFWRMIWQEHVASIVMLIHAKKAENCTQYWPDVEETRCFGFLSVKVIEERKYANFIERKMSVSNKEKSRLVSHYHYTAWPDEGSPEPMSLLVFHNHVLTTANKNQVPTVVHCSAGVGRTGTYIALDALYHEGKNTGKVNVAEFVKKMRDNRVSMVQTYEQYITVYLALGEIFKAPIQMETVQEFCTKTEITMRDNPKNRNPLHEEFQLLKRVMSSDIKTEVCQQQCSAKQTLTGKSTDKVFEHDGLVRDQINNINPIYVPSFTRALRFMVTEYPTRDTSNDFIRLLTDNECDTVICVDPLRGIEHIQGWLPKSASSNVVDLFTGPSKSISRNDIKTHKIKILQEKKDSGAREIVVLEPQNKINPQGNPPNTSELLALVSSVIDCKADYPIMMASSDGASLCGVFIAVHNVIQQLNMDGGVDVFTAVRQLQVRRPELCNTMEEYEMIYRAVYDYIQNSTESIYSNQ